MRVIEVAQKIAGGIALAPAMPLTTPDWEAQRRGKFTASRIAELCTRDRSGKEMGKTAMGYIMEVLAGQLGDDTPGIVTKEMQYGKDNEPAAAAFLAKKYGKRFKYYSDVFVEIGEKGLKGKAGASPDFMVGRKIVGEIKVPYTTRRYLDYMEVSDNASLLRFSKDYYYQVQMQMWATKTEKALFVAFNPKWVGTDLERKALHIVEIERDEAVIAEMRQAIQEGLLVLEARKRKIVA